MFFDPGEFYEKDVVHAHKQKYVFSCLPQCKKTEDCKLKEDVQACHGRKDLF